MCPLRVDAFINSVVKTKRDEGFNYDLKKCWSRIDKKQLE